MHEAPPEEQNFAMVMEMLAAAEVREEDEEYESPLDILFARLEMRNPESIAVKQYHVFKMGAGKTLKSILISVGGSAVGLQPAADCKADLYRRSPSGGNGRRKR